MNPFPYKSVVRTLEPTPDHAHCFFVAQSNTETTAVDSRQQAFCLTPRCNNIQYIDLSNARLATADELHGLIRATSHEVRRGLSGIDSEVSTVLDPDPAIMDSGLKRVRDYTYRLEVLLRSQQINILAALPA